MRVLRLTEQNRQDDDTVFCDILMQAGKGIFPTDRPLPFNPIANIGIAYSFLGRWPSTLNKRHVESNTHMLYEQIGE